MEIGNNISLETNKISINAENITIKSPEYKNEIRHENTKNKTKGKDTIKKGKKNPSIYKVSIIIE